MIIDAQTIFFSFLGMAACLYFGLQLIRQFALQIAQENHDAVVEMDQKADQERRRKERAADQAAQAAFARVQPILTTAAAANLAASKSEDEQDKGLV
eukprot:scaffold1380_cov161-Amphora_coffeaeformis.AAC.10